MSSGDEWFKRWGRVSPFGPWSYADVDAMVKEMEKEFLDLKNTEVPEELVREKLGKDGSITRDVGPTVYGYSMTVGPDGKPVIREFGNVKSQPPREWLESVTGTREPLVDLVDGKSEVRLIAELPGVKKNDVEVIVERTIVTIRAESLSKKYYKEVRIPSQVELGRARSTFNNGILEVTFPKKKARRSGVRIKVD